MPKLFFFEEIKELFHPIYSQELPENLSEINKIFIIKICEYLSIKTKIISSENFDLKQGKTENLVGICKELQGDIYLSSPMAKNYLDEMLFKKEDIDISYFDYSNYSEYYQLNGEFKHNVSILDLLFNEGSNAIKYMKLKS